MGNGVGNNRGVVDNRGSVVDGVGKNGGVVGNGVVGDRVSDGMASVDKGSGGDDGGDAGGDSVADNSSVANVGDVGHRSRGSGSKAEEGRDRKGLN